MHERPRSLTLLQRCIKCHMAIAGGPSAELCGALLKMPDLLDGYWKTTDGYPDWEVTVLAHTIAHKMVDHIVARTHRILDDGQLRPRLPERGADLQRALADVKLSTEMSVDSIEAALTTGNALLQRLGSCIGHAYPDFSKIEG